MALDCPNGATNPETVGGIAHLGESGYHRDSESANSEEHLPGPVQNPSARIISRGVLCARLISVALFAALILAASATVAAGASTRSARPTPAHGASEALPAVSGGEEAVPSPPEAPAAPEVPAEPVPVTVPVPPVTGETVPVVGEAPEATPITTPVTTVGEEVHETVPSLPESPRETTPVPTELPTVTVVAGETPEARPSDPTEREPSETALAAGHGEEPPKEPLSATSTVAQAPSAPGPGEGAPATPTALVSPTSAPAVGAPGETSVIAAGGGASEPPAGTGSLRADAAVSCEVSLLGGPIASCTTGWLRTAGLVQSQPVSLTADPSWSQTVSATPAGGGHDESAVGGRPATPSPGPGPGGASGSAAVGGSGLALSAFLTLTGLLLLAAPRAMRRLRLSCEPWLTAFFVLIPERPG
jgi:hypothetical protein